MQELLAVALGGSIGAVSRYLVTNYIFIRWHCHWPWATFIVNAAGCLAMGFLMVLITEKGNLAGAGLNIIGSVVVGVVCAWFGAMAARSL